LFEAGRAVVGYVCVGREVSGRRRLEQALEASQRRFRDFAEMASDWLWETDAEGRYVWFSDRVRELVTTPEQYFGKQRLEVLAQDALPEDLAVLRGLQEARAPWRDVDLRRRQPDGEVVHTQTSGMPIFDEAGRFRGYRGIGRVVTAQKRLELALRESEQRFKDFAEASTDWLWETDEQHRYTWFSENVRRVVGVAPEWHYGKRRRDPQPPGADPAIMQRLIDCEEARKPWRNVLIVRRGPDGDRWVRFSAIPVFDQQGRFKGYRGSGSDATEQVRLQQALHHSEERFRDFAHACTDWLWETDESDRFVWVSEGISEVRNSGPDWYVGRNRLELMRDEIAPEIHVELRRLWLAREPWCDLVSRQPSRVARSGSARPVCRSTMPTAGFWAIAAPAPT